MVENIDKDKKVEESKIEQITARPLKETVRKLAEGAKKRNLHPSTWYAKILDKAAKFEDHLKRWNTPIALNSDPRHFFCLH